jgi:hypothetical protein
MSETEPADEVVAAIGKASEALEYVERARGHLYAFHQLMGRADLEFESAADLLGDCGLDEDASWLRDEIVGRNVLDGRWSFQIVEEFDDLYHQPATAAVRGLERSHLGGVRHVHESRMKEERRTPDRVGHESRPPAASVPEVDLDGDR